MSIFDATNNRKNEVRVNKFDWSHANNFTTEIGRITPIFCELFPQKGSFRTEPVLGLQFMPMVFPIQTRMKARVSFFRYPLRALWKDYRDYVGNFRPNLVEPYHDFNGQIPQTGDLYDYLGLPTTFVGSFGKSKQYSFYTGSIQLYDVSLNYGQGSLPSSFVGQNYSDIIKEDDSVIDSALCAAKVSLSYPGLSYKSVQFTFSASSPGWSIDDTILSSCYCLLFDSNDKCIDCTNNITLSSLQGSKAIFQAVFDSVVPDVNSTLVFLFGTGNNSTGSSTNKWPGLVDSDLSGRWEFTAGYITGFSCVLLGDSTVLPLDSSSSPFYDSTSLNKEKQIKISAFAARAYEGIYNAYFRDDRNNPYYVNGEVQYNKWIPTDEGGADTTQYKLHYANWEKDFLTTAVQSPQQGVAPLVGITTYEDTVLNEDGTMTTQQRLALVDEDGRKFGLEFDSDADGLNDVRYTELSQGQVVQQPRSLYNLVQSGISINDIRNVNAYQKYLELNMRSGYSYKDIIQNRFNVKVRYSDLLMPEFIGGFTEDIEMHSITQNVETNDSGTYAGALGSQAGLAGCRRTGRPISCFCDEESIIIGVCVVTPVPVYTQLLPKHFTYRELLDHYQPEFNNIGFQPITYKEVCPVQAYNDKPESLNDTFGYQRPWYEFVQKYDVAHGLYRTQLRNFLMNRTFNVKPELSESFLLVDPEQVNDVFSVTETTDKIYGQIYFKCTVKLPISRVSIPRLD